MLPSLSYRFSVRSALLLFASIAILLAVGMQIRYQFFLLPMHASIQLDAETRIADAVSALNEEVEMYAMDSELLLEDWEIVDAVMGQREIPSEPYSNEGVRLREQSRVEGVVEKISSTGLLPTGSKLDMSRGGIVTLEIPFDAVNGYGFIIRHPGLVRQSTGKYKMNFSWQPRDGYSYAWNGKLWQTSGDE